MFKVVKQCFNFLILISVFLAVMIKLLFTCELTDNEIEIIRQIYIKEKK